MFYRLCTLLRSGSDQCVAVAGIQIAGNPDQERHACAEELPYSRLIACHVLPIVHPFLDQEKRTIRHAVEDALGQPLQCMQVTSWAINISQSFDPDALRHLSLRISLSCRHHIQFLRQVQINRNRKEKSFRRP